MMNRTFACLTALNYDLCIHVFMSSRRRYRAEILPIRRKTLYIRSMSHPNYLVMKLYCLNTYTFIVYIRSKCILFWISYQTLLFYIGYIHKFVDMFV